MALNVRVPDINTVTLQGSRYLGSEHIGAVNEILQRLAFRSLYPVVRESDPALEPASVTTGRMQGIQVG